MSRLRGSDALRNTIVKAKDVVRRLINRKIDDFVDLADRNWCGTKRVVRALGHRDPTPR